jgi:hypothetical protein
MDSKNTTLKVSTLQTAWLIPSSVSTLIAVSIVLLLANLWMTGVVCTSQFSWSLSFIAAVVT